MKPSDSAHEPPSWPITDDSIREVFDAMLLDGSWGRYHGPHCDQLREALAEFHSVEHVALCSSGTSAVELALRAAQVRAGDEVILAAYDYKANFANVLAMEATPILVDTLPGLPVPDPEQIPAAISEKTKAIICSHLHGSFASVDDIKVVAAQENLIVIEDACQSAGGMIDGAAAGSIGDIGVLSFGGSKLLTAGRGGAVLTNDATLAQRIKLYTQRGNDAYPLSEMQAAVLLPQLQQLPDRTMKRRNGAQALLKLISDSDLLQPAFNVDLLESGNDAPAFYKVAFRYDLNSANGAPREEYTNDMRNKGVALDPAFPALHLIHGRSRFRQIGNLPNATSLHDCLVTLHHPVLLSSLEELQYVAETVTAAEESGG